MGMKGYKAFRHGFYCEVDGNRKQYEENSIAEDTGANGCCEKGVMHFCETPLDCLDYYPLIDNDGKLTEFAEVEALDDVHKNGNKRATKRLRIGAKLSVFKLGEIQAKVMIDSMTAEADNGGDAAQQVGGNYAKQVGGNDAQQVGGYAAKQVGGNYAQQESGKSSIVVAGEGSMFKTGIHSVVLRYWYDDNGDIARFKAAQVDGTTLKPDTWYKLENGEFVEVNDD